MKFIWELKFIPIFQHKLDFADNVIYVIRNIAVPKSQDFISARFEEFSSSGIVFFLFQVSAAIHFDDEFSTRSAEVHDVVPKGMLSSEFNPIESFSSQVCPEFCFGS